MCDADDIIKRLKDIINQSESDRTCDVNKCCEDNASISSCSDLKREKCPKAKYCDLHYTTPTPSGRFDCEDSLPDCRKYEVRCKQTLDGNVAKPTIVCSEDTEQRTFYPPMYFNGGKFGGSQSYKPINKGTAGSLGLPDLDQLECACKNGFCPPSRYDQFMAGKGGLPLGHPDNARPEKFHYTFGMGVNNPAAK